ncbi:Glycoside hydrolase family 16 [Exiguobacterium sp. 8H]|uniref:carbohydrate binding domain-containing protein n=1 Tax=Exiguobacterium TaxID=33986 RepID=UPI0012F17537|nr:MULTISPECIES: carbohydrate binding domain-containing protein [Exiguobacterium]VXB88758.1 Glycoside hydrolase family 16 [Exiguobacterium sp. 8H]VXC08299.1 Glycoside hydrolase family 16 [Exiguobacterium sp. 8A]
MKKWVALALGTGLALSLPQEVPAEKSSKADDAKWKLVWSDEFSKSEIDHSKWNFETGNWIVDKDGNPVAAGWGNNEKQFYTDKNENAFVKDGKLVIRAKKEQASDQFGTYDYTSAKLTTKGTFSKTYGRYEMRAKLPTGKGLWPAFWMLPEEDRYGGWAASGEIDIMESWGSQPDKVAGTIHYGETWPNNKYTGKDYHFAEGDGIDKWHTYAVEWEPGEIRWYVDGQLYQTQNDWYAKEANKASKYSYPAPFDQDFYLIMNLAVGGWFDGDVDETTPFPAEMEVDYVRVFDLKNGKYRDAVEPTYSDEEIVLPEGSKQPLEDGNLVYDENYTEPITTVTNGAQALNPTYWNYVSLPDFGGVGSIDVVDLAGTRFADISIDQAGSQPYSHQLIQNVSLGKGGHYKVTFDAKADAARSIAVKVGGGPERGYAKYSDEGSFDLTTDVQTYSMTFDMTEETDLAARLEFNVGLSTSGVQIGNVRVEQTPREAFDPNATKPMLGDGNHVYNGTFDQGAMDRMTYWTFDPGVTKGTGTVDSVERLFRFETNKKKGAPATLVQQGIQLQEGHEYVLRFKARAERVDGLLVGLNGAKEDTYLPLERIALSEAFDTYEIPFTMEAGTDLMSQLQFILGSEKGVIEIDDVELRDVTPVYIDPSPLKNGAFTEGLTHWGSYVHFDAQAAVEAVNEAAHISITQEGNEAWSVLLEQVGLELQQDQTYVVQFDASSTVARSFEVTLENVGYYRYLSEVVAVTPETNTYTFEVTMPVTDVTGLKFLMGRTEGSPLGAHDITIDNVSVTLK